jgi:zinc/manganese transport system substrate-binding protein
MPGRTHAPLSARGTRVAGVLLGVLLIGLALASAGCSTADTAGGVNHGRGPALRVVAAENFWGSIAGQLGGTHVDVTSIITNPSTDPHDYEATASDARTMAAAQLLIVNGIGYDQWASDLAATTGGTGRVELNVGRLVGVAKGGNPHRWYDPTDVARVISAITADYQRLDPANAGYYAAREQVFNDQDLSAYHQLVARISKDYAGTPVGASESIFAPLAQALGLDLITPPTFLDAISEGSDPSIADKNTIDRQISQHLVRVYVFNSQNATPDVQAQVNAARSAGIPVVPVTETLAPAGDTFQQWQVAQLNLLASALRTATGH